MTFLELCQRVFDEGDRAPYEISTVEIERGECDEQLFKIAMWVKQAYKEIQQWNRHFSFHFEEGILFSTLADGTTDYTVTGVRNLIPDSLIYKRPADSVGWPVQYLTYKQWRDQFKNVNLSDSLPIWFTEMPGGNTFRVSPGASEIIDVHAAWWTTLDVLEYDADEPIWDEDNHDIIVWVALKYYMSEYETPEELVARINFGLRYAKKEFLARYLPDFGVVGEFAI